MIVAALHMKGIQNIYALHEKGEPHLALWFASQILSSLVNILSRVKRQLQVSEQVLSSRAQNILV